MAKAGAGGGGPDLLLIAAVGVMAMMALRSRGALAGALPTTATQMRPDYTAARNIAYAQAGVGLVGAISGLFGAGSPDTVIQGGMVSGTFGGGTSAALDYNANNGWLGWLGRDATDGFTPAEFGNLNGAYTFGSGVEVPNFFNLGG